MLEERELAWMRRLVLGVFLFGAVGVSLELVLLEHYEQPWQWVPLVLLGLGLPQGVILWFRQPRTTVRVFRITAALFVVGSAIGLTQHFRGNMEFELEMYPTRDGLELVWESLKGATPALAPGTMALLGLLGLTFTFHHPALSTPRPKNRKEGQDEPRDTSASVSDDRDGPLTRGRGPT